MFARDGRIWLLTLAPEMQPFADQCVSNLRRWSKRLRQLESSKQESAGHFTSTPRHPDEFITAFPLTLPSSHRVVQAEEPRLIWPLASSRQSGESSSGSDSHPCSPSPSVSSFTSESFPLHPGSSSGSCTSFCTQPPPSSPVSDCHAAIRAAGKLGIRKQRSLNRNSWSPSAFSMAGSVPKSAVTLVVSTKQIGEGAGDTFVINQMNSDRSKTKLSR